VHFASAARFLEFNIMTTTTQAEFVERVKDVVSRVPKGEWITGIPERVEAAARVCSTTAR
jgi:hypothetical protein